MLYRFVNAADGSEVIPPARLEREPRVNDCLSWGKGTFRVADGPAHYRRRDNPHVHWVVSLPAVEVKPEDK